METTTIIRNAILFCGLSASCFATSAVYLNSSAAETTNNSGSATVNIPANPGWAPAVSGSAWVSFTQSGDPSAAGFTQVANGTSVIFTDTFNVADIPYYGAISVMADDTTSVTLNGVTLASFAPSLNNSYTTCSDFPIGCTAATASVLQLTSALKSGENTLSFDVEQISNGSFGLDYSGVVCSAPAPEPGTMALFGLPLVAVSLLRRKRKA